MIDCQIVSIKFPNVENNGRLISVKFGVVGAVHEDGLGKNYQSTETVGYIMRDINHTDEEDMKVFLGLKVGDKFKVEKVGVHKINGSEFPKVKVVG